MWSEMHNVMKTYGKLNTRNKKKDELHLNKHAMHLVRLYLMGIDLFESGKIITYREKDLNLLHSIRNGKYMLDDGTFSNEFFDMVDDLNDRFDNAIQHSVLPAKPQIDKINKFMSETFDEYFYGKREN